MFTQIILPVVAIVAVLVTIKVPIYLVILAATFYLQYFVNAMPLQNLFNGLFEALTKNSLMAIPYFVLAGNIIASSSLGQRLVDFFIVLLKKVRAGLAIACLLSNAVFGAISGSPPAAIATFGKIVHGPLKDAYGEKLSLGLITSSGALSAVIPPSIVIIMFGISTDLSVAQLFMGGFIPGVVIVLIISIYLLIKCKPDNTIDEHNAEEKVDRKEEIKNAFVRGIPVLIFPILVLGGIYGGFLTPTEAGAFSAFYAFVVAVLILKDISIKETFDIFMDSAKTVGQLFMLIGVSTVFAQATAISQLPQMLAVFFSSFDKIVFLLLLNVLLLIIGLFFDSSAAVLIVAPLLLPAATNLGINPIHLGIIFTVNLAIGMFTPPFGLNIFITQSIFKKSMGEISVALVPFIILYILGVLLITYIPQLTLFLPNLLY